MIQMETKQKLMGHLQRQRKRLAWAAGSLALVMTVAWFAVPVILKSQAEKWASKQLGRSLSIGRVDFRPWTLELEIKDVVLAKAAGQGEQLRIGRAYLNTELQSLLRWAPVVDAIEVEGVRASLTHLGEGKYDIDDMLARLQSSPKPASDEKQELPRFAIFNIALKDWALEFDDQAVGKQHRLKDFQLSLPFLSSLPAQREVKTEPQLAFELNGSRFDSKGQSTPFVKTHRTDASIQIKALDLAPYLPYLKPLLKSAPIQAVSAVLGADLKVTFEENPKPSVRISGQVSAQNLALNDLAGRPLLGVQSLAVRARDVQPLAGRIDLESVEIGAPSLQIRRDAAGRLNLATTSKDAPKAIKIEASSSDSARAGGTKVTETAASPSAWQVQLGSLSLQGGSLTWTDESLQPKAQLSAQALNVQARNIVWPFTGSDPQALAFEGSSMVEQASLSFSGTATDAKANVNAELKGFQLSSLAAYLKPVLEPSLSGELQAQLKAQWRAGQGAQTEILKIALPTAQVAKLALNQGKTKLAQWNSLTLQDAQVDVLAQSASIQKLGLTGVQTRIERSSSGRWMVQDWLRASASGPAQPSAAPSAAKAPSWKLVLNELEVEAPLLSFVDRQPFPEAKKTVSLDATQVKLRASGIEINGKDMGPKPIPVRLSLGLAAGHGDASQASRRAADSGQINLQGQITPAPLALQLQGQIQRLPVHALEPYFGEALNIDLLKLDASYRGRLQLNQAAAGMAVKLQGDVVLEDLQTTLRASELAAASGGVAGDELVSWKALNLRALALDLAPGAALKLDVGEAALTDFFARILISEQGRINLADIVKSAPQVTSTTPVSVASNATNLRANSPDSARAGSQNSSPSGATTAALAPLIQIGRVSLINGKVYFADRFIKPNYAANLSELTGSLGAFSSQPKDGTVQMAPLELRGKAEGTAQLEILGQLNPLARPLALDISGKVRDLELAPLSPYSVKYAGHGIERGKLSVDVKYSVKPDGQLTASNNIVLNQLRFGDKVEGAPNSLPVKLAVALLADRNGVIDINLPIQGSLNDPQFSIGPIVFKLIVNLVVKAITSPFSLLASAFGGGGDELSQVAFAAGSAQLQDAAKPGLDKVIKALQDRPALKMTVVGQASAQAEREGYKKERLKALVAAEKRRNMVSAGTAVAATQTAAVTYTEAEYPALLKAVYRRSDVPKPRNAIGMVKDIPVAEMEALLLASLPVTEQAMQELATARGVAVRDYLASKGLGTDRLFLGAPKAVASPEQWTPKAELSLASQ
jgi:hypothetical protein